MREASANMRKAIIRIADQETEIQRLRDELTVAQNTEAKVFRIFEEARAGHVGAMLAVDKAQLTLSDSIKRINAALIGE